jgi:hypothetical protein
VKVLPKEPWLLSPQTNFVESALDGLRYCAIAAAPNAL